MNRLRTLARLHWARGRANYEARGDELMLGDCSASDAFEQEFGCSAAELLAGLMNCGEGEDAEPSEDGVVVTDDRNLTRDINAKLAEMGDHA